MDGATFSPSGGQVPAPGGEHERRGADRYRTVCRIARVTRAGDVGLWRVRNISDTGLMLAADVPAHLGEDFEIALSETVSISAKVMWVEKGQCGVAFTHKIDAAALLRALAVEQRAERYRALRLPIDAAAVLAIGDEHCRVDLVDLSKHGAGFRHKGGVETGLEIELLLSGGEIRRGALVRWVRGRRGGLWFTHPLDRADLESIVRYQGGSTDG